MLLPLYWNETFHQEKCFCDKRTAQEQMEELVRGISTFQGATWCSFHKETVTKGNRAKQETNFICKKWKKVVSLWSDCTCCWFVCMFTKKLKQRNFVFFQSGKPNQWDNFQRRRSVWSRTEWGFSGISGGKLFVFGLILCVRLNSYPKTDLKQSHFMRLAWTTFHKI